VAEKKTLVTANTKIHLNDFISMLQSERKQPRTWYPYRAEEWVIRRLAIMPTRSQSFANIMPEVLETMDTEKPLRSSVARGLDSHERTLG
jgi:hypothetical protein